MRQKPLWIKVVNLLLVMLLVLPVQGMTEEGGGNPAKKLSQEELAQLVAPIALYPDALVSQILMASTYPLEVVQADRWAKKNKQSTGDALTKQLEKETWDPSVKSLVSFPTVLASMSEKLDVTTKIGDAFLSQQKEVMQTIQLLRKKAYDAGNLKTTKEQQIIVEKEVIVIQPTNPQVVYVPTYSPTVVYGVWAYPAYPPYYYYPPPPPSYPAYTLAVGIAIGAAWHNNSGNCNWGGNNVYVNHNQNVNINRNQNANINRGQGGQGAWQHNPEHRKGVAYKDGATAKQYGQSPARSQQGQSGSRGYGSSGSATANRPSAGTMDKGASGAGNRPSAGTMDRGGSSSGAKPSAGTMDRGGRDSAFSGGGSGSQARAASDRGMSSRQSSGGFSGGGGGGRGGGGGGGGRR